ncbi:MAG TPA: ABC transporter ATP-binding protein [Candidatus Limnocylindrales bacterium]
MPAPVIALHDVVVRREGTTLLGPIDWLVSGGERWAILGPNGSGKTTLLRVASSYLWPSSGSVELLGNRLGDVDARELRQRVGYGSPALAAMLPDSLTAREVVVTARFAALGPWWHTYSDDDRKRAADLLVRLGCGALAERAFGVLSTGERQRVQIARALMAAPDLLLLDEPAAGLDLGAREALIDRLSALAAEPDLPAIVLVTHHVEEIPAGFTHALLLRAGVAVACGSIDASLTGATLSDAFGLPLELDAVAGRYAARRLRGRGNPAVGPG